MKRIIAAVMAAVALLFAAGCSTDAQVVSHNISKEADQFRVDRRIVGINLITGDYLFMAVGKCSIAGGTGTELAITCKIGPDAYQKHFIGMPTGANVTYTVEQLATINVDSYHYEFVFKPSTIIPTVVN